MFTVPVELLLTAVEEPPPPLDPAFRFPVMFTVPAPLWLRTTVLPVFEHLMLAII